MRTSGPCSPVFMRTTLVAQGQKTIRQSAKELQGHLQVDPGGHVQAVRGRRVPRPRALEQLVRDPARQQGSGRQRAGR